MWFHPPEFPGVVVGGGVPSADAFFNSRMFFGDQLVCGVTAFAVPGLSAQREPRRTLFCTAVAPQKLSGRFATCPAGTQC